ncbi:MAG: hypothetical protein J6Z82_07050, partial [Schwartzia sp.]|nr:hypothetical protein [Schwartzia sp. (in: firmicutes)]
MKGSLIMKSAPKNASLKQKMAVAMSLVNTLNVCAPIALPYVNVTKNVRADGGQAEPLRDARIVIYNTARALYGTAQATTQYIPSGSSGTFPKEPMETGDTQNIFGGIGTVTTMIGGVQWVFDSGKGTVETMSGGYQYVEDGGTGTVTSMTSGKQIVSSGGAGTVSIMSGGQQDIGTISYGGVGGSGTIENMSGGKQFVYSGGTGTVSSLDGGTQVIKEGGTSLDTTINSGGKQIAS